MEIRRKSKNPHSDKTHAQDRIYVRGEAASYATLVVEWEAQCPSGR